MMQIQDLRLINDVESESINGGGTGTGQYIQLDQAQSRLAGYQSAPIAFKEAGGNPNSWGKHISEYVAHINQ